jgi:hypothetical protein
MTGHIGQHTPDNAAQGLLRKKVIADLVSGH